MVLREAQGAIHGGAAREGDNGTCGVVSDAGSPSGQCEAARAADGGTGA